MYRWAAEDVAADTVQGCPPLPPPAANPFSLADLTEGAPSIDLLLARLRAGGADGGS